MQPYLPLHICPPPRRGGDLLDDGEILMIFEMLMIFSNGGELLGDGGDLLGDSRKIGEQICVDSV